MDNEEKKVVKIKKRFTKSKLAYWTLEMVKMLDNPLTFTELRVNMLLFRKEERNLLREILQDLSQRNILIEIPWLNKSFVYALNNDYEEVDSFELIQKYIYEEKVLLKDY